MNAIENGLKISHFFALKATFEKLENELREVNQNAEALKKNYLDLTELRHILRKTQVFFDEVCFNAFFGKQSRQDSSKYNVLQNQINFLLYSKRHSQANSLPVACIGFSL